jgi:RNA polymerase sigma-70 factor (ECF subfamily)
MKAEGDGHFPTTSWTLVARLRSGDEGEARRALDEICAQYRFPLYCFIRRRGLEHHDAEDALHDFLAKLIRLDAFAGADADKGRLRAYLATALGRFLSNRQRNRSNRQREQSLEALTPAALADAERWQREGHAHADSPEHLFDRQWGFQLLGRVLEKLRASYREKGRAPLFEALEPVLKAGGRLPGDQCAALASRLEMSEGAVRAALNRLLQHYREALEAEVFQTVTSRSEVTDEIAHLLRVMQ